MTKRKVYLRFPNSIRNSESDLGITAEEMLLAVMLLEDEGLRGSRTTLGMLETIHNLGRRKLDRFKELIPVIHDKGLVNIVNIEDIRDNISKHTLIVSKEVEIKDKNYYTLIDLELIHKILYNEDIRIDKKENLIYLLLILQSRGGYRDFTKKDEQKGFSFPSQKSLSLDTGMSIRTINSTIQDLIKLGIIAVVNFGSYTTKDDTGKNKVQNYNNTYIVIQLNYTDNEVEILVEESKREILKLEQKAKEKMLFSKLITNKTGDNYKSNKIETVEEYIEVEDFEKRYYEKIEKQRVEREIEEQQEALENWKKDIENGQKPY